MTEHGWQQAVDVRGEIARFFRSEDGAWFAAKYAESADLGHAATYLRVQRHLIEDAEATYWVIDEVTDLAKFAADSLPRFELRPEDLPTKSGFLLFEKDQYGVDVNGRKMSFRAISWALGHARRPDGSVTEDEPGIAICFYSNKWAADDWYMRELRGEPVDPPRPAHRPEMGPSVRVGGLTHFDAIPAWSIAHYDTWRFGDDFDDLAWEISKNVKDHYEQEKIKNPEFYMDDITMEEREDFAREFAKSYRKLCLAMWLLMQQPVTIGAERDISRQQRRQLERKPAPGKIIPRVTVVTLRRAANPQPREGEMTERHFTHRWIVRGHWRMQWYASEGRHKPLWIEAFQKGPEGTPLVLKHKVFEWVR